MKEEDSSGTDITSKSKFGVIKKDIAVFTVFLFISFILWYLNSLSKENEAGVKYQVRYVNIPKDRTVVDGIPAELTVFFKGPGYSLLKLKISEKRDPLKIDISKVNYKRTPGSRNFDYYIITSGLIKSLNVQLRSVCEITSVKPDTLFFSLDKISSSSASSDNKSEIRVKR